jgi:hypothetical protein
VSFKWRNENAASPDQVEFLTVAKHTFDVSNKKPFRRSQVARAVIEVSAFLHTRLTVEKQS